MTPAELTGRLRRMRFAMSTEAALQVAIERALIDIGVPFEREARLGPGERVDFMVNGGIALEAKAKYPKRAIYRQLERYARHEDVDALLLITGTAMGLPAAILGKPVFYVSLGRAAL